MYSVCDYLGVRFYATAKFMFLMASFTHDRTVRDTVDAVRQQRVEKLNTSSLSYGHTDN